MVEALPLADPFAPSTIVVGSHLVSRWLQRELALARGIAAGLDLVTFDAFVERLWTSDGPDHTGPAGPPPAPPAPPAPPEWPGSIAPSSRPRSPR